MKKVVKLYWVTHSMIIAIIAIIWFSMSSCNEDNKPTVPDAVTNFTATAGDSEVVLSWTAPSSNGGSTIIMYRVSSDNGKTWVNATYNTYHIFSMLTNGNEYTFKVCAVNAIGTGAESTQTATPVAVPDAVTTFTATTGNGEVVLSWTAPSSDGGSPIIWYQVSSDNGTTWVNATSNTGHTFTELTNGMEYTFKVCAVNAIGTGTESTQTATPVSVPDTVTDFTATAGDRKVVLSWTAPSSDGGSPIIVYRVSRDNGATWVNATYNTGHTFTRLTNGNEYTFKVCAVNAVGTGTESTQTTTPVAVPGAIMNFTATAGNGKVILSWIAPSSDGGSLITGYRVSSDNGETWVNASSNTGHTFTGLTNGMEHIFKVCAVNAVGTGTESTQTATPVSVPGAVTAFTATTGDGKVILSWTAPSSDGGSPITGYRVSSDNGATWVDATSNTGHTFTGLTNGEEFFFKVCAVNATGTGAESTLKAKADTIPIPEISSNHPSIVPRSRATEQWYIDRHNNKISNVIKNQKIIFIGDSYTMSLETNSDINEVWTELIYRYNKKITNLGYGGDFTQDVIWRLENGEFPVGINPEFVVLMIGTNNTFNNYSPESVAAGIGKIAEIINTNSPSTKIILFSILPSEKEKSGTPHTDINNSVNEIIQKYDGYINIMYFNIGQYYVDNNCKIKDELYASDKLHLSVAGYKLWKDKIVEIIEKF